MKYLTILLLLNFTFVAFSQNLPQSRITDWINPGCENVFKTDRNVRLSDYGADKTGISPSDEALKKAIKALNGPGRILVAKGEYLFNSTISIPDSIIIEGESVGDVFSAQVKFKLNPGEGNHGISIIGREVNTGIQALYPLQQGEKRIFTKQAQVFSKGDLIKIFATDDSLLVASVWAYNSTGQILKIVDVKNDSLYLDKPLRRAYSKTLFPFFKKVIPRRQVHIKCINLERIDATTSQTTNVYFNSAYDCSFEGVESVNCNYAHISITNSKGVTIENCFFRNSHSYGSGGKGYGIVLEFNSGDCFVHKNMFDHLRHSMLLQAGVNGNVVAYNYSKNPYWTGTFLPSNSAGDLVLHGNYPYMNLFEGNVVQHIVIDNSHGKNGPYNTFFRNRAELYGIYMNSSPASDQQNFILNQISNQLPGLGAYVLKGNNHFEFDNVVKGKVISTLQASKESNSLFSYNFDSFYLLHSTIPPITKENWNKTEPLIEAQFRYFNAGAEAICSDINYYLITPLRDSKDSQEVLVYPNPFSNSLTILNKSATEATRYKIYNSAGKTVFNGDITGEKLVLLTENLDPGIYFLEIGNDNSYVVKLLKIN